jgi:hypothetical protein
MASTIKLRRGTASEWTSADPTLSVGEFGYETDTSKLKIGDGSTAWTSLDYFIDSTATTALNDLTDVTASGATTGQILVAQSDNTFAFEDTQYFDGAYSSLTGAPTNVSSFTNDSGYLTGYTVTQSDVTAHQAALSITESQISDLQTYLTSVSQSDVTAHQAALSITESQISDLGSYLSTVALNDLTDVTASGATTGHVLTAQSDNTFAFEAGSTVANLNDLTDVTASGATTGQVLTAQSDGSFVFADAAGGTVYQNTYVYEASSGQTSFSGADDNGYGLTFTSGQTMVFLNGVLLVETTDYSEDSDLAGITLVESANTGDIILISTWETSEAEVLYSFQGSNYGYTSGGGPGGGTLNTIDRFPFASATTNASDVGDLTSGRYAPAGQSSLTNGYTSGGFAPGNTTNIETFLFSSATTNASDVGDLTVARRELAGQSSSDYGYSSGGYPYGGATIDKFPFASDWTGTATDVGDQSVGRRTTSGQSSTTHGYTSGGIGASQYNIIDRFPFASDGNATDVGDLLSAKYFSTGQSSSEYGYNSGGTYPSNYNVIERFPFASATTNSSDVGDLTVARSGPTGQSSTDYGYTSGGSSNVIDRFTFASATTNASDVGDLTVSRPFAAGQQY